jgi:uncharacterized protein YlxW (UPF0749 family)
MDTFTDRLAQRLAAQEIIKANSAAEVEKMQKLQSEVRDYQECVAQMRIMNGEIQREVNKLAQIVGGMSNVGTGQQAIDTDKLRSVLSEAFARQAEMIKAQMTANMDVKPDMLTGEKLAAALDTFTGEKLAAVLDTFTGEKLTTALDTFTGEKLTAVLDTVSRDLSGKLDALLPKLEEAASRTDTEENLSAQLQKMLEEITTKLEGVSQNATGLEEQKRLIQETQEKLEEHIHKENVKVYRNVQAVIMEESTKQSEAVTESMRKVGGKVKAVVGLSVTATVLSVLSLGGIAYLILTKLGILF